MAYNNIISRSDIAARQKESVMKTQSSPKISSGKGASSPKNLGSIRPAFKNLK